MQYAGLPEGAEILPQGLPEGAEIITNTARTYTPQEIEAGRRKFVSDTGTTLQKAKEYIPSRKKLADFVRPTLEGGGAVLGGIGGAAVAIPADVATLNPVPSALAGVAGAGLGYATGKKLADFIEGAPAPKSLGDATVKTLQDVGTGATLEMGGQVAGKLLSGAATGVKRLRARGLPLTDKNNTVKAGEKLAAAVEREVLVPQETTTAMREAALKTDPALEGVYAKNARETRNLMGRVKAPVSPTLAQTTGSPRTAALEQSQSRTPDMIERMKYNDAQINQAALSNMTSAVGPSGAPVAPGPGAQTTGVDLVNTITAAREPVKAAERQIWGEVPNYPMPAENFTATAEALSQEPMVESAKGAVNGILSFAKEMPKTVQGLQGIERTIGSEINKAARAGDNEAKRALTILKDSIRADFEAMGAAAEAGDIALHNGAVVYPSKIQAEIGNLNARIAGERAAASTTPDMPAITAALREAGDPPNLWMKQMNESPAQYGARLTARYQQMVGPDVPSLGSAESAATAGWKERVVQLEDSLANLQPAEDVAARYTAAKRFSKLENFDRFNTGAVKDVLKAGDELSGYRLPPEAVPSKFFTPTGSDDLVRAVGKAKAKEAMLPHITEQLTTKTVGQDGVMAIPRAMAFLRQNKVALQKLGIEKDVQQMVKGQVPAALRAKLEAQGVDVLGNPTMTARQAGKLLRDYGPAIKQLYGGDSAALRAMQDYHKVLELLGRNKNVSYSGGSTTTEKLNGVNLASSMAGLAIEGKGFVGSMARNIMRGFADVATKYSDAQVNALLQDAILNPETAQMLMKIARGAKVAPSVIDGHMATLAAYAAMPAEQETPADPLGILGDPQ